MKAVTKFKDAVESLTKEELNEINKMAIEALKVK